MNREKINGLLLSVGFALVTTILLPGCDIDSAESGSRNVNLNVQGFYHAVAGKNNDKLVSQNTGQPIVSIDLRQSGDQLEGIDNNGNIFKGTIGQVDGLVGTINLEGMTTAGENGTISGTISVSQNDTSADATMQGTWVEPNLFGTVYAQATVPLTPTNAPPTTNQPTSVSISPTSVILATNGETRVFNAYGGGGSYIWNLSANSRGSLSATTGDEVIYPRTASDNNTLTVQDEDDVSNSASVTVTQP